MIESLRYDKGLGDAEVYARIPHDGQFFNFTTLAWEDSEITACRAFMAEIPDSSTTQSWYSTTFPTPNGGPYPIEIVQLSTGKPIGNDLVMVGGSTPDISNEPITLGDVQGQIRWTLDPAEYATVGLFITAVRQKGEAITRRALVSQARKTILDGFPSGRKELKLIMPPLISVESVTYIDQDGVLQTLDPSTYRVITDIEPGYIVPVYGSVWPSTQNDKAVVTINYTCGYVTCPAAVKQWMLLNVASLYENRESETVASGKLTQVDLSTLADSLLADFRVITF